MRGTREGVQGLVWVCAVVMVTTAIAGEAAKTSRVKQREAVEAVLARPADWTPEGAGTVTLGEFIEHVRAKHGLSIRWDAASIRAMSGITESFAANGGRKASPYVTRWNPLPASARVQTYSPVIPAGAQQYITNFAPQPPAQPIPAEIAPAEVPAPAAELPPGIKEKAAPAPTPAQGNVSDDEHLPHMAMASRPIDRSIVAIAGATVGEVLDQLLDAAQPPMAGGGDEIGVPIVIRAFTLTYLVEAHSVVITTRLRANALKETRVYRIGHLRGMPPEQMAKMICHTVRPWSWRTQAGEIADRLAARFPKAGLTLPQVAFSNTYNPGPIVTTSGDVPSPLPPGVPGSLSPMSISAGSPSTSSVSTPPGEIKAEDLAGLGQLLTGGAIAAVESIVNTVEIVHYGDPPTGVMEVLPGALVVTQSQAAHREIAELLEELATATP